MPAARHEHLELVVRLRERAAAERHADLVRAGSRGEFDVLEALVDLLEDAVLHLVVEPLIFVAADDRLVDRLAVEGDDHGVLELHVVAPDVPGHIRDVHGVLAVGREHVSHEHAAARAERQALHVRLLVAGACPVRLAAGPRVGTAHRAHRERTRRDHVLLDERRRDLQAARDVVEVHDLLVLRQELGRVDLEREQLMNCVRVFLTVEPVRNDRGERMLRGSRRVQRLLEPRDERREALLIGTRLFRRRHQMAAQLAHGLLEGLGVLGHARGPELLEVEVAGELGAVVAIRAVLLDELPLLRSGGGH